ncbi:MAG: hypothetical protein WBA13_03895 [Microcoleaceae cyanobacterium]
MMEINTTLPESLAQALEIYTREQVIKPNTNTVIQTALEEFLAQRGYFTSVKKTLRIKPASLESGFTNTSINHDQVLTSQLLSVAVS